MNDHCDTLTTLLDVHDKVYCNNHRSSVDTGLYMRLLEISAKSKSEVYAGQRVKNKVLRPSSSIAYVRPHLSQRKLSSYGLVARNRTKWEEAEVPEE